MRVELTWIGQADSLEPIRGGHRHLSRNQVIECRALVTAALGGTLLLAGGAVAVWPVARVQGQPPIIDVVRREPVRDGLQSNTDYTTSDQQAEQDSPEQPDRALEPITSMAVAPDGRTAATGFADGMLSVWRVDDRKELYHLEGHSGEVTTLAFAPDGRTLVSGGRDRLLIVWHIGQEAPLRTLTGHTGDIRSIAFAPDGTVMASGSEDGIVRIWNTADGTLLHALSGHTGPVTALAFTRDRQSLASGSEDGTVHVWGAESGTLLRVLRGYTSHVTALAFGGGDTLAIGSFRGPILLLEHGEDGRVHQLDGHSGRVTALNFAQDGQTLASSGADATLRLWEVSSGRALGSRHSSIGATAALVFLPDGTALANGSTEGTVRVWDMKSLLAP